MNYTPLDNTFTSVGSGLNSQVNALALQSDGQVLAGGLFTSYSGTARNYLARLNADGSLNAVATPVAGATFSWSPGGSATNPLMVTTAGTYTPTATLAGGCTIAGDSVVVRASSLPDLVVSTPENVTGDYNNVTVTGPATGGAGTATLTGPLTVAGTLTIQTGGTLLAACQPLTGPGNFVLEAGGTLGICDPVGITRSGPTGSVQLAGTRSYSDDAIYIYNGTVAQVTGDGLPALVRELEVNNAHTLALTADVDLRQVLRLRAGDLILLGHNVTLRSDPTGTALVDNRGGNVLSGPGLSRMQRYIDPSLNAGLGYRHFASPLLTTPVGQLATVGFTPVLTAAYNTSATPGQVAPFPTVYAYDEARLGSISSNFADFDKGWFVPTDFEVGRGLTVNLAPPALVTFSGFFNGNPTNTVPLSRGPQADAGWHLLGNPYPAPFDLGAAGATTTTNVGAAVYVYESSSQYAGSYRPLVNGIGNGPQVIAAGQGFFVRSATAGQPSNFRFNAAGRVTTFATQPTFRRGTADTRPQVELTLTPSSGPADATYVYAEAGATSGFDPAFDASKILNPGNASVYALSAAGAPLAVQGLPVFVPTTTVPLVLAVPTAGPVTFTATLANLPAGLTAFLTDAATGTHQDLTVNATYRFTAPAGRLAGRFALVFGPAGAPLSTTAAQGVPLTLYPNPAHTSATLTMPTASAARPVRVLDALGREVRQLVLPAQAATATLDLAGLPTGVYVVRCGAAAARLVVE